MNDFVNFLTYNAILKYNLTILINLDRKEREMYSKKEIRNAAKRAIKNILYEGTTDVELFTRPFEINFLKNENTKKQIIDDVEEAIRSKDLTKSKIKPYGKVLVPKKNLSDFRICALIDIYDEIYFLTLVLLMSRAIEEVRIIPSKKKVFSYRLIKNQNSEKLFDSSYTYTSFKNEVKKKEQNRDKNIVVECDIANFYDRLNLHRLESTLLSIKKIDDDAVDLLNKLLLLWSNRDSYGLPVGSNASRILAEAALTNVDQFLVDNNIIFCRFVDDYRIFAKDSTEAYRYLTMLIERLQIEGLFVNSNKTNIREAKKFKKGSSISKNTTTKNTTDAEEVESKKQKDTEHLISKESKEIPKIIRGYSGLVPLKFRQLSLREISSLKEIDLNESYESLQNSMLIEPENLRKFLKATVAQESWILFGKASSILEKFPQFIPFYVDIFKKHENLFTNETIELLKTYFFDFLNERESPEYIKVYILRFFSGHRTFDKERVLNFFYSLSRNSGNYIGRATLEILEGKLNRSDLLTLRQYFVRADIWEKREILNLINNGLPQAEKKAYFKNISITNTDLFINHMVNEKTKFMK